ncbi:MAG: lasso peptide biosynthesis B2 protein [Desulfobacterales bacterium]|nr:lasso peptide biosynthesis B2 protein [Desulfobacterales bacterium]
MRKYTDLIIKFLKKSLNEKIIYLEVIFWLAITRLSILTLHFKFIARFLGKHMAESEKQHPPHTMKKARVIAARIYTLSKYLPWECKCLVQAISGKMMLKKRKITNTMYLGVCKDNHGMLMAHAWLRVGDSIILGGDVKRFTVVATFA